MRGVCDKVCLGGVLTSSLLFWNESGFPGGWNSQGGGLEQLSSFWRIFL